VTWEAYKEVSFIIGLGDTGAANTAHVAVNDLFGVARIPHLAVKHFVAHAWDNGKADDIRFDFQILKGTHQNGLNRERLDLGKPFL